MQFLFSFFLVAVSALELSSKHAQLQLNLADLSPSEVKKSIDDFKYLVGLGEDSRAMAIKNQTNRQKIYDDALDAWQKAFNAEQTALRNQKEAEDAEQQAIQNRDDAIQFKNKRVEEKNLADSLVPPARAHMEKEQNRVASERASLDKVKEILDKLLANGGKAEIELSSNVNNRRLLSSSRTVTLLTAPSFIASLANADPSKVQSVLDIVLNLMKEGEADQKKAEDAHDDAVNKAQVAADNLLEAKQELEKRESELKAATAHKEEMIRLATAATAHEVEMRKIRDEMKILLDIQIEFTNRELERIAFEEKILREGINLQTQLHEVTQLLA